MEQQKRRASPLRRLRGQAAATICFLLLAGFVLYACVALLASILRRDLPKDAARSTGHSVAATPTPAPVRSPLPTEPVAGVSAILRVPDDSALEASSDSHAKTPVPLCTPAPTLRPLAAAKAFSSKYAEFVLLGFDKAGQADWIVIVRMNEAGCSVLSVPRNALAGDGGTLATSRTAEDALERLRSVWPVRYRYYMELDLAGIPQCIDSVEGIFLNGTLCTGEQTAAYLALGDGSDELLRIMNQQTAMRAWLCRLQSTSWLNVLTVRFSLQKHVGSNLSITQLLELFTRLKRMELDRIVFSTLPVDSVKRDSARCYTPDVARINHMLEDSNAF